MFYKLMTIELCHLEKAKNVRGIHFMCLPVVMAGGGGLRGEGVELGGQK